MRQKTKVFSRWSIMSMNVLSAVSLTFPDFDNSIEFGFRVASPFLDFAFNDLVIGRVHVVVQRRGDLLHLERREIAIVDAFLQRVDISRFAEIGVGIGIDLALRRCRQSELQCRRKIFEDRAPCAFVTRAATMAFVDDDEIEKVRRIARRVAPALRWRPGRS